MRQARSAVSSAVELMNLPSRVRAARTQPLPPDVGLLLRLATGDGDAEREAALITERTVETNKRAAAFFIEQILLSPDADSYRILGGTSATSSEDLRRNMALLVKYLHPDIEPVGDRSIFVRRVTAAWEDLKTPDRRANYDSRTGPEARQATPLRQAGRPRQPSGDEADKMAALLAPPGVRGLWFRLLMLLSIPRRPGG